MAQANEYKAALEELTEAVEQHVRAWGDTDALNKACVRKELAVRSANKLLERPDE